MHDSTRDTFTHIEKVRDNLNRVRFNLSQRARHHDASKLESPEKEAFDQLGDDLKDIPYGSEEYRAALRKIKPAIQHHYSVNDHHPEYYDNGIRGMSALAILEMLADWKAAGERVKDGSLAESLKINRERFRIENATFEMLLLTALELGWIGRPALMELAKEMQKGFAS